MSMALATSCATKPAPEFAGRWKPVNRYAEETQEIPLDQAYTFQPSPMDGTLKNMLARWARDSKMTLSYEHTSDFTLHGAVSGIRSSDLRSAAGQLTQAFAAQRIAVELDGNRIVVRPAAADGGSGDGADAAP